MGRPGVPWRSPEELDEMIEDYFQSRWSERKFKGADGTEWTEPYMRPPTMSGLGLAIGVSRITLLNYSKKDEFSPIIARAKARIAEFAEEALYTREGVTGARFSLEVNHRFGREEADGHGESFVQNVMAPRVSSDAPLAIPKWSDETGELNDDDD